jgi:hypothetical protein
VPIPNLATLSLGPKDRLTLGAGTSLTLVVTGTFADGSTATLDPGLLNWSVNPASLARVGTDGWLHAVQAGSGTVLVTSGPATDTISLQVVESTAQAWGQTNILVVDIDTRQSQAWGQTGVLVVDVDTRQSQAWGQTGVLVVGVDTRQSQAWGQTNVIVSAP